MITISTTSSLKLPYDSAYVCLGHHGALVFDYSNVASFFSFHTCFDSQAASLLGKKESPDVYGPANSNSGDYKFRALVAVGHSCLILH